MMIYSGYYRDENGNLETVTITEEDSKEALKNDYAEIMRRYNPRYVSIRRLSPNPGEALRLELTLHARSDYLTSVSDTIPKACDSMSVTIVCFPGYPMKAIKAHYPANHYLASVNVFRSGDACIDTWSCLTSSLITVADKLLRDMIHCPEVTRTDSPANSSLLSWYGENLSAGKFPTMKQSLLFAPEETQLPPRREARPTQALPPLPPRHR